MRQATKKRKQREDLLVIGTTGSYGKTTTKEFLAHILSQKFNVLKTEAHNNTELAIANTLLRKLKDSHEVFIVEMGAYRRGEIKTLCEMTQPKIGILTGINDQHISLFGSQENIIKGKYELIEALPPKGLAVFNGDNKYCAILYYKTHKPKRMYSSFKDDAEYKISNIAAKENLLRWSITVRGVGTTEFEAPLIGRHYVENCTGAIIIAFELGMNSEEIQGALSTLKPFPHTMELKKGINGIRVIDDSYSGKTAGVFAGLDALSNFSGQKVIVMPTLIELGKDALDIHKDVAKRIAEVCKTAIITGSDFFGPMQEVALANGMTEIDFVYMIDPHKIVDKIKSATKSGDVVLLESRVPRKLLELLLV
jgi:UDP-N-acetylmuramoyl-tripeptide--D-alanyl-D-alanine ligase